MELSKNCYFHLAVLPRGRKSKFMQRSPIGHFVEADSGKGLGTSVRSGLDLARCAQHTWWQTVHTTCEAGVSANVSSLESEFPDLPWKLQDFVLQRNQARWRHAQWRHMSFMRA